MGSLQSVMEEIKEVEQARDYDAVAAWFDGILEVAEVTRNGAGDRLLNIKVLVTLGGPNIWVTFHDCGAATIAGFHGYKEYKDGASAPQLQEYIFSMFDMEGGV